MQDRDDRLATKVAVVTGGGSGLGKETARMLAAAGARVFVMDRDADAAAATIAEIAEEFGSPNPDSPPDFITLDVMDHVQVGEAFAQVVERAGAIDVLVNSAGIREIRGALEIEAEEWLRVIGVNLTGTFFACQAAARHMVDTGGGAIVNFASVAGLIAISRRPAYAASKHAIVGLTKCLAKDLAAHGIRVNAIAPGTARTPMAEAYFESQKFLDDMAEVVPMGTHVTATDVARAALFLVSSDASFITGVTLPVDGGWVAEKSYAVGAGSIYNETDISDDRG